MNWTLEVVVVPVSDVDRAKAFYSEQLGFTIDHDTVASPTMRFVQLTPPGSGCSIVIGTGLAAMEPGSLKGLQLVVNDVTAAREQLLERGVDVSDLTVLDPRDGGTLIFFDDPDGNSWVVQQLTDRD